MLRHRSSSYPVTEEEIKEARADLPATLAASALGFPDDAEIMVRKARRLRELRMKSELVGATSMSRDEQRELGFLEGMFSVLHKQPPM